MSAGATLWETAPATTAVQARPMHELLQAQRKLDQCREILRDIDLLLAREDVSAADKLALSYDRATTQVSLIACLNLITACEERMRQDAKKISRRHGWLL